MTVTTAEGRAAFVACYWDTLLNDVVPFWLRHSLDREQGGYLTALDRDGSVLDTDKSIWFQGRGAWLYATLYNTVAPNPAWLEAATLGLDFLERHARSPNGKLYFTVTRDGQPLRMRRYVYSEAFAAIAHAAYAKVTHAERSHQAACAYFTTYLRYSFEPGLIPPKIDPQTRPMVGLAPFMIAIVTAQELRANLGDVVIHKRTCSEWITWACGEIERLFWKPESGTLLEVAAPDGTIIDHFDGRTLNPGHALECAWFILHEARTRGDATLQALGLAILDGMWARGWDTEYGGIWYFRDVRGLPVQEYWHDMKFWWPHCEAIIATLLAWTMTGDPKYALWHQQVHDWSFRHFADAEHGEWYGYLHRDGRVSVPLKGNMWKGPFHLPRMLWYCGRLLDEYKK